jgi:hypothetical protein
MQGGIVDGYAKFASARIIPAANIDTASGTGVADISEIGERYPRSSRPEKLGGRSYVSL